MSYQITESRESVDDVRGNPYMPQSVKDSVSENGLSITAESDDDSHCTLEFTLSPGEIYVAMASYMADMWTYIPVPVMRRMAQWILDNTKAVEA